MTATATEEQTADPPVEGSSDAAPKTPWWRHQLVGVAGVLIAWFSLTVSLMRALETELKGDIAAVENRLTNDITAVENRLKNDITAAEGRVNTNIAGVETRLSDHLSRVEGRLDRILETISNAGNASALDDEQEETASR